MKYLEKKAEETRKKEELSEFLKNNGEIPPEIKATIKKLINESELPFRCFCENEAAYRLAEAGVKDPEEDQVAELANIFFKEDILDTDYVFNLTKDYLG